MGVNGIAAYLNEHGYKKKKRQNNTLDAFATSFIKGVLDNPIYCGKLAFGRRKTERVPGKRNEFRIVKQDSYILSDGIHEAIISEDDWNLAKQKRNINGVKHEKIHSLEHEHILSGILKCPICGKGMYGNVNRKKKKDGTFYKDYFYYACKHRYYVNGHKCDYRKQWNEEKVNDAVAEVIKKLVNNPKFEAAIRAKINSKIDTGELETEHENLKKQLRQVLGAKNKLGQQMDNLDISDKMYDRKYQDMQDRLNGLYDEIERLESLIDDIVSRKEYIRQQKISEDGVYQYLLYFDKLYDKFTDMEKKEFMNSFVERVDIYEDEQPNGRFLKHIKFKFPVFFDGEEIQELSWDNETTVETVVLLSHKKPDGHINVKVEFGEGEGKVPLDNIAKRAESYKPKERVTYKMIKEYIEAKYGFKVHTAYIAEVKRDLGLPMYDAPNAVEELKQPRKHPTVEKVEAIKDALKHFEVI